MLSRLMTRREQLLSLVAASSIILGALSLMYYGAQPPIEPEEISEASRDDVPPVAGASEAPAAVPEAAVPTPAISEPARLVVAAMGGVRRPGLHKVKPGTRVGHLIDKAGGTTDGANTDDIDLAALLIDGTTLTIPEQSSADKNRNSLHLSGRSPTAGPNPPQYLLSAKQSNMYNATPSHSAPGVVASGLLDINTASSQALDKLPSIGPALAARIIEHRPFTSVEQLDNVPGIGVKTLAKLRPHVCVR